jgi:hypothetical protein
MSVASLVADLFEAKPYEEMDLSGFRIKFHVCIFLLIIGHLLKKQDGMVRTGFIWLRIETSGGLLWRG